MSDFEFKIGQLFRIVNSRKVHSTPLYKNGDILKVTSADENGGAVLNCDLLVFEESVKKGFLEYVGEEQDEETFLADYGKRLERLGRLGQLMQNPETTIVELHKAAIDAGFRLSFTITGNNGEEIKL